MPTFDGQQKPKLLFRADGGRLTKQYAPLHM